VRPHLRHTSRLTVRPDGTQSGQLLLTYFPVLPGRSYQAGPTRPVLPGRSYQEPTVRIRLARRSPFCNVDRAGDSVRRSADTGPNGSTRLKEECLPTSR
jgi:hypothetical protein